MLSSLFKKLFHSQICIQLSRSQVTGTCTRWLHRIVKIGACVYNLIQLGIGLYGQMSATIVYFPSCAQHRGFHIVANNPPTLAHLTRSSGSELVMRRCLCDASETHLSEAKLFCYYGQNLPASQSFQDT